MHQMSGFALTMTSDDIDQIQHWLNSVLAAMHAIDLTLITIRAAIDELGVAAYDISTSVADR